MQGGSKTNFFQSYYLNKDQLLFDSLSNTAKASTTPTWLFPAILLSLKRGKMIIFFLCKHDMIEGVLGWRFAPVDSLRHVPNTANWYRVTLETMNAPALSPHTLLWRERWGSVIIGPPLPFTCPRSTGSLSGLCCSLTGWLIKLLDVKDKSPLRVSVIREGTVCWNCHTDTGLILDSVKSTEGGFGPNGHMIDTLCAPRPHTCLTWVGVCVVVGVSNFGQNLSFILTHTVLCILYQDFCM